MYSNALSMFSPYHLVVTWPAVFLCALMLVACGGGSSQEEQEVASEDQQLLLYMESERRRLRADRAAAESRTVVSGRVNKRRRRRTSGVKIKLEKGGGGTEERGQVQKERQRQRQRQVDAGDKSYEEMVMAEMEVERLSDVAADILDKGILDKAQPTINQDQIEKPEKFVSLAFSFQSRHSPLGSPPHSPTQTSIQAVPTPPPAAIIKTECPSPHTLGPITENYSLRSSSPPTIVPPTPSPPTPQRTPPTQPAPPAKSPPPPPPGSYILRRRPPSSHLPNSIDTTDLYDGPFFVIPSLPAQRGFVTISLPAGSLTPSQIAVDEVVVTAAPERRLCGKDTRSKEDEGLYLIDRIRGERVVEARSGVGWAREMLVHWEGWGCEDDSWEPEEGLPAEVVDAFDERVVEWRVGLKGY
ncbi:uncharacterized protein LAJ45_09500 [Morchella importuna]|uniref:uncharacterized protein n=1 Tax=Morchella importuna TaxID=1174673 RepID=UPI001E8ED479|nr:uncharacterized protein LAJ45_09500 [Morchella importuna]KAH8146554.1 hypothetical protein LAJ45_09500 [Morchella importuna]